MNRLFTTALRANTLARACKPAPRLAGPLVASAPSRMNLHTTSTAYSPKIQQPAPQFKATALVNSEFKQVSLNDYKGKWVILFFYPLDFTFVCPTEIIAFSDRVEEFKKLGAEVLACSVDSEYSHLAWTNTPRNKGGLGKMNIPLLADITKQIASSYGVLLPTGVALRGLFIIDPNGVLRQMTVNDLPVGRSVDETLRLLEAFQYVEKHGEVCPANWKKGAPTMKANPKQSLDYFEKVNK